MPMELPLRPWITFAGIVLVVVVLYAAQTVIVPIALAGLFTFVLASPVNWLERRIGNVPAVLTTVVVVFALLGLATWGFGRQITHLADDLPGYRKNVRAKVADIRGVGKGGSVEKIQNTLDEIKSGLEEPQRSRGTQARPVIVAPAEGSSYVGLGWIGTMVGPLGTAAMVVTLVIFMLLERHSLRDRLIGLVGDGQLALTTRALDEAGSRVSRQLLMQSVVNLIYGLIAGAGLYLAGVPYALVWAALGAVLRFIPYVGPIIGAGAPIAITLAALEGWRPAFAIAGFYVALELFTNLVLETILYAGAAGVSQVALLVSVAFWTWLWGPVGLAMSIPLTVCLVVIGKHVPGMDFVGTLLADSPPLAPESVYYQRLLARDISEAADVIERYITAEEPRTVYDAVLLPALNYVERDRLEGRVLPEDEAVVVDTTRELLADASAAIQREETSRRGTVPPPVVRGRLHVLGYAMNRPSDEVALHMLADVTSDMAVSIDIASAMRTSELVERVRAGKTSVVCIADLPPSSASKTRYMVRRLRASAPDLRIIVGRWAPPALVDERATELREAGADVVLSTLGETREYLQSLLGAAGQVDREHEHAGGEHAA